jgi:hypothetical protein
MTAAAAAGPPPPQWPACRVLAACMAPREAGPTPGTGGSSTTSWDSTAAKEVAEVAPPVVDWRRPDSPQVPPTRPAAAPDGEAEIVADVGSVGRRSDRARHSSNAPIIPAPSPPAPTPPAPPPVQQLPAGRSCSCAASMRSSAARGMSPQSTSDSTTCWSTAGSNPHLCSRVTASKESRCCCCCGGVACCC